jgi:D-sedoheptulose 7-phosphate isomerase
MKITLPQAAAQVQATLLASAEVKRQTAQVCTQEILQAAEIIAASFRRGGKLLLCGNGGSAADCQHIAGELVNRLSKDFERPGLPAIALTTDSSLLSAIANDYSFEQVFERQVETLGQSGDVLLGISTSGKSSNVIRALKAATNRGMQTILLTGNHPEAYRQSTINIAVPSDNTQYIQEAHLAIEHILCTLVEHFLFRA